MILALIAVLLAAPASPNAQGKVLAQRIQRFYGHTKDFTARFTQRYTYTAMGRVEVSEGTVQVKKPGFMRWDYEKPERRTMFLEGRSLWIWRPDDQEAQHKKDFGGAQLSSAFTFLWGKGDLLGEFSPRAARAPEGLPKGDALELLPKKPVPGIDKLVFVVGKDGQVLASVVTNPQGDVNQMVFGEAKVDQHIADSTFRFEPPKGAYVQEL